MSDSPDWPHREAGAPGASDDPSVSGDAAEPQVGDDPADDAAIHWDGEPTEGDAPPARP